MKYIVLAMTAVMLFSFPALARSKGKGNGPCRIIRTACEQAGYYKGGWKEGKGLWKNCVNVIIEGGEVPGVEVAPGLAVACKERRAQRKIRKMGK